MLCVCVCVFFRDSDLATFYLRGRVDSRQYQTVTFSEDVPLIFDFLVVERLHPHFFHFFPTGTLRHLPSQLLRTSPCAFVRKWRNISSFLVIDSQPAKLVLRWRIIEIDRILVKDASSTWNATESFTEFLVDVYSLLFITCGSFFQVIAGFSIHVQHNGSTWFWPCTSGTYDGMLFGCCCSFSQFAFSAGYIRYPLCQTCDPRLSS